MGERIEERGHERGDIEEAGQSFLELLQPICVLLLLLLELHLQFIALSTEQRDALLKLLLLLVQGRGSPTLLDQQRVLQDIEAQARHLCKLVLFLVEPHPDGIELALQLDDVLPEG